MDGSIDQESPTFAMPCLHLALLAGGFALLHLVRAIGYVHGALAKHLLVKSARI